MARGFRGYGGGGRSGSGSNRGSRSASGPSRGESKGRVRDGKVVQYSIRDPNGKPKYVGSTNNPRARAAQHRDSGKLGKGDQLVVETKPVSRQAAQRVKAAKIGAHRRNHGKNPIHNKTNDGQYHLSP